MRFRFAAVSVLLTFLFGCGGKGREAPKPLNGFTIAVQSSPPGAEILLDGKPTGFRSALLGTTPMPLSLPLTEGQPQLLTLRVEGYHDWHQWVERTTDGAVIVQARLRPASEAKGELLITSEPSGAKIFLDGNDTGRATPTTLPVSPSSHAVKLELPNFLPAYETVFVPSGERVEVHIPLQPKDKGVVSGVLYDRFGGTPSGFATLQLRTPQGTIVAATRTSAFGLFRFPPVPPSTYTLVAEITVEGATEVGQMEGVIVQAGQRAFVPVVVFPADLLGSVKGVVRASDGKPVADAQVSLLYYAANWDFVLTSRRTLTDRQGRFAFENVPAAAQVLVARKQGYQAAQTQVIVRQGERASVEIILTPLGQLPELQPPTGVFSIAYTVPTEFLAEGKRQRAEGGRSFYRQVLANLLRRHGHPAARILAASLPTAARFFPLGFMGSVGIGWQPPLSIPSKGLLGYRIYRAVPTATGWQLRMVIDEPEQTVAEDVAFDFTPSQTYRYSVSAILLDGRETKRSEPAEATFLPPIRLLEPPDNAEVAQSQLQFRWTPVGGTVPFYVVQLYSDLEALLIGEPVWSTAPISNTTQVVYDGQPLLKGKTYWWLVIGTDQREWRDANAFTLSVAQRVVMVGD